MSKLNNEIECPYYQHGVVNEDGDDFYDLCYGEEKGEYCCDEENKNCLYRQLQQLKTENEELKDSVTSARIELDKQKSRLKKHIAKLEQECEKWKSYYELYRIETDTVKKVQAVINGNLKYGIEFTENGIINKDERLSYLEIHEQIKLIIDEQAKELDQLKAENEELKKGILLECPQCGETYLNKIGCELYEEKQKYKQCLDEIEKIANDYSFPSDFDVYEERDFYFNQLYKIDTVLQKIKEVKEGE